MNATDILGLMVPATYFVLLAIERLWPARDFPPRESWQWIGIAFLLIQGSLATLTPLLIPADWLDAHRLLDGTRLGVAGGAIAGFVLLEAVVYAYHRAAHRSPLLWRLAHQLHHSPRRVDMPGSVLFHPVEMLVQVTLQLFVLLIVMGLDPLAVAIAGYLLAFYGMFQHWNVRTPQWLGYLIQRPEAHCVHHRLGLHYYNFADLPVWDILFGTFRNPREFRGECGFEGDADRRLLAILRFDDVNASLYGAGSRGQKIPVTSL
jgi:sterol desaturase/sphingolipid hydroxylase (fatty acid hydroxylase superfamily)